MIEKILDLSVRHRWFIVLLTAVACALGVWSLNKLPIDAVPDVTNNQVQINAIAPALTPVEMEKQITFQIENILAGTPTLEYTRSFSRNGFAQVTAVFRDKTSIYFARQQVNERLQEIRQSLPPEAEVKLGPISTGLGEVYWWAVEYQKPPKDTPVADGKPGWQSDGSYLTPEGRHLRNDFERAVYLRTVQDWIIRPQMRTVPGIAGADAIGGYVKQYQIAPDPAKSIAYGISFADIVKAVEANNASRGANYVERNGENYVVRAAGRIEDISEIGEIVVATRGDTPLRVKDLAEVSIGRELRTGSASLDGHEAVLGTALMLVGGNSRTVSAAAAAKIEAINKALPPGIVAKTAAEPDATGRRHHHHGRQEPGGGRASRRRHPVRPARQFSRGIDHGAGDSGRDAVDGHRHAAGKSQRQPDESRRDRLRPDRRRRRHHHRKLSPAPRQPAAPARPPARSSGAAGDRAARRQGDGCAVRLRAGGDHAGLHPAADVFRRRRQDVRADGADRHHRLALGVRAVADIRSGDDRDRRHRACAGKAEPAGSRACRSLPVGAHAVIEGAGPRAGCRRRGLCAERHGLSVARTGVQPDARRKEPRDRGAANSQHVAGAIAGHAVRSRTGGFEISRSGVRVLPRRDARYRRRSDAAERRGYLRHPEAAGGMARSVADKGRTDRTHGARIAETGGHQFQLLPADPDALQRADRRCSRGYRGQDIRRRVRADAEIRQRSGRRVAGHSWRPGRQGRAGDGAAVRRNRHRQEGDIAAGLEHCRRSGRDRYRDRRAGGRAGVRRRPPFPDRGPASGCAARQCRRDPQAFRCRCRARAGRRRA